MSDSSHAFSATERAAVYRAIAERRDMRHFSGGSVAPELLARLLEAAHQAPSVGLMQPWRFIRITEPALRRAIHGLVEEERGRTAEALGERSDEFMRLKVEGVLDCAELLVAALMDDRERHVFGRRTLPQMDLASLACAIQNLWLASRAEGLGRAGYRCSIRPRWASCSACRPAARRWRCSAWARWRSSTRRRCWRWRVGANRVRWPSWSTRTVGRASMSALLGILGVVLDARFGEPQGWHPLVAFGRLADRLERRFNRSRLAGEGDPGVGWRSHGVTAWVLAVLPLTLLAWTLAELPYLGWLVQALALYAALGLRSLGEHAEPVALALRAGDLDEARRRVGYLVSRDTRELDQAGVARAATESVLENGSDAVYAALFWFAVAGAPGVVLYRLSNTLDAMWGYRNARFERFGWAAAKIDDILNYLPARLVALTYALLGDTRQALRCWREQAPQWDSPNAGPVMAAGAGALGVSLGGAAIYHGELHQRPLLGSGPQPQGRDIYRALALVRQGVLLWLLVLAGLWAMGWLHA